VETPAVVVMEAARRAEAAARWVEAVAVVAVPGATE
jgi:hypothetical protein